MLVNTYCFVINQQVHSTQLWQVHRYTAVQDKSCYVQEIFIQNTDDSTHAL